MGYRFHEGERQAQELAGEQSGAEQNSAMIADRIISGAVPFLQQQRMAVIASEDKDGMPWCSVIFGQPGFLQAKGEILEVDLASVDRQAADPVWENLEGNPRIGILAIDLATRRRYRINGTVTQTGERLQVTVNEAFPNCGKYISRRQLRAAVVGRVAGPNLSGVSLGEQQIAGLQKADVLFVATKHVSRGLDASHRGGTAGFIEVLADGTLQIPDYAGNSLFNTLGNLLLNPHAGLAVPDFENGRILQLIGTVEILWNDNDAEDLTGGTHRFWKFHVARWKESALPSGFESNFLDYSPFNPPVMA